MNKNQIEFLNTLQPDVIAGVLDLDEHSAPAEFELRCLCGSRETVSVPHFTQLYQVMNDKGWGLIPTQHGRIVQGVCPDCKSQTAESQL